MISAAIRASGLKASAFRLHGVPKSTWWLLAVAFVGFRTWAAPGNGIYGNTGDADDVTRLLQVREWMASGNWFDTTTMKMGGDGGMLSHWSRLIDLPLAALIRLFSLVMPVDDAERLTHIVWPLSLFAALLWVTYRCVGTAAGERAARITLVLVALAPSTYYQFAVGRIDHHNAMIAAIVSATLIMWSTPSRPGRWLVAGALVGLAIAVGYEALAPAVALGVLATVWAFADERVEKPARAFALSLALAFAIAFLATTAPSRWMDIHCDAISLNMVVLIVSGVSGLLVAVGPARRQPISIRISIVAAFAAVGIAGYGWLEPKCLAGPEGQLPALLSIVWLNHVAEGESPVSRLLFKGDLGQPLGLLAFLAIALTVQVRETWRSKAFADWFLLAVLAFLVGLACWQYKYSPYASFVAVVPLAVAISRFSGTAEISAPTIRLAAMVLLSESFLLGLASEIDHLVGAPKAITAEMRANADACTKPDVIRDLADLSPGLIASHIDAGAYIAGLTHHRVLAAPYHRIANAIIANYDIFSAHDPRSAAAVLKAQNVDYVVVCRGLDGPEALRPAWVGTLKADLVNGKAPDYLVPVALSNSKSLYRVWRVDRNTLNLLLSTAAASTH